MKKKLALTLIALMIFSACAYAAINTFNAFAPDEFEQLRSCVQNADSLSADIETLERYVTNPTYDDKAEARQALSRLKQLAASLETLSQIVNAKQDGTGVTYVLNMKSMKFHDPACSGTRDIKISLNYTGTREEITALGFEPCGRCKP